MAASNIDPALSAMLDITNANADRKQAEIDLQRAMAREQFVGRTAVGGVFAQLQQRAEKEIKQRQKIQEQGAQQAPPPESMLPPTTEVDGRTSGRSGVSPLLAAGGAALATIVSGGAGVKQANPIPQATGAGGGINPQAKAPLPGGGFPPSWGQPSPQPGGQAPPPVIPAGQQLPAGQTRKPGPPGSVQPVTRDLSKIERALLGPLKVVGGVVTRNAPLTIQGVSDVATGEEQVGIHEVPTESQQAATLADPIAVMMRATSDPDPQRASFADMMLKQRLDSIDKEFGPEVRRLTEQHAYDRILAKEEEQRLKYEDPIEKAKRDDAQLDFKIKEFVSEHGVEQLKKTHPGWFDIWEGSKSQQITNVDARIMAPKTESNLEERAVGASSVMQSIDQLEQAFFNADGTTNDEVASTLAGSKIFMLQQRDKMAADGLTFAALSDEEKTRLERYTKYNTARDSLTQEKVRAEAGLSQTLTEMESTLKTLPNPTDSPQQIKVKLPAFRERMGLGWFRHDTMLAKGVKNPSMAMSYADTKLLVRDVAQKQMNDFEAQGMGPTEAKQRVSEMFRSSYGLDLGRVLDSLDAGKGN